MFPYNYHHAVAASVQDRHKICCRTPAFAIVSGRVVDSGWPPRGWPATSSSRQANCITKIIERLQHFQNIYAIE
jgi:hypothetical protein